VDITFFLIITLKAPVNMTISLIITLKLGPERASWGGYDPLDFTKILNPSCNFGIKKIKFGNKFQ